MYLCKYGYLNCDCTEYLHTSTPQTNSQATPYRGKRDLSVLIPTEFDQRQPSDLNDRVTLPNVLTTPSSQTCTSLHFRQGYEEYQYIYRLPNTGMCDSRTKELMSTTRCGQPDMFNMDEVIAKDAADTMRERKPRSVDRSVKEIIYDLKGTSVDRISERRYQILKDYLADQRKMDQVTYNGGDSTRRKRSVLDIQANEFLGFMTKRRISWRLMSSHTSPDLPITLQNAVLMHAFRYWSEVSPLCFEEKKSTPSVDIEIGFLEGT